MQEPKDNTGENGVKGRSEGQMGGEKGSRDGGVMQSVYAEKSPVGSKGSTANHDATHSISKIEEQQEEKQQIDSTSTTIDKLQDPTFDEVSLKGAALCIADDEETKDTSTSKLGGFLSFLTGRSFPEAETETETETGSSDRSLQGAANIPSVSLFSSASISTTKSPSALTSAASTLWARRMEYVHNDKGGLFSAQSSSNHSLIQIMRVTVRPRKKENGTGDEDENEIEIGNDDDKVQDRERRRREAEITEEIYGDDNTHQNENENQNQNGKSSSGDIREVKIPSPVFTESVTIVGFMNLSNMPFCQNCTYKTRWEFRNTEIENANKNGNKNTGIRKTSKMGTEISVFLTIDCPSSIYHSFIVSGIKKELKAVVDQFQLSAKKLLDEMFFCEKTVRGNGEKKILEIIGKDFENYEIIREEKNPTDLRMEKGRRVSEGRDADDRKLSRRSNENDVVSPTQGSLKSDLKSRGEEDAQKTNVQQRSTQSNSDIDSKSDSNSDSDSHDKRSGEVGAVVVYAPDMELTNKFVRLRDHWRLSAIVMTSLKRAPTAFSDHLAFIGLRRRRRTGILSILRLRMFFRILFWGGLSAGAIEVSKRSGDIAGATVAAKRNVRDFVQRRITTPTMSIMNDVVLNRRVTILDKEALIDARRSLSVMLYDFLSQHKPKLTEQERRRLVNGLDMRPISEEYERELRYVRHEHTPPRTLSPRICICQSVVSIVFDLIIHSPHSTILIFSFDVPSLSPSSNIYYRS